MRTPEGRPSLRILHVSEVQWGGVVTLLDHFVAEQVASGHEVHVLAPPLMPRWPGVTAHDWCVERNRPATCLPALRELRRTVGDVRPDVIHLHSFIAGFFGRLPFSLSAGGEIPVVYQPHAWSMDLFTRPSLSRAVGRWEHNAARRTDVLVTNCRDEILRGEELGVSLPSRAIGVAVDLLRHRPVTDAEKQAARDRLGWGSARMALVLGRVAHQKGQDLLVPAWERQRPADTILVLAGPGDTDDLRALAPGQWDKTILAVGEPEDATTWLIAADVLLLPSRYETVGLVVAEAMATGIPVIATAVDGAWETLIDGDLPAAGAVVPLHDMAALLAAADERLRDPALWHAESRAGRRRAEAMFQPETTTQRLEDAYLDAIAHRQRGRA